jgi:hypothetical protein
MVSMPPKPVSRAPCRPSMTWATAVGTVASALGGIGLGVIGPGAIGLGAIGFGASALAPPAVHGQATLHPGPQEAPTEPGSSRSLNLDLAQTLLELGDVPAAAGMQGRSIVPILRGQTPADWRDAIELAVDPHELRSVYDDPRYAAVRDQLKDRLQQLRDEYDVPAVDPVPHTPFDPPAELRRPPGTRHH